MARHYEGKKNFQIHLRDETRFIKILKQKAQKENISLAELCRRKLREEPQTSNMLLKLRNLK